jgi:CBS domain containing-hemolysin-like protein
MLLIIILFFIVAFEFVYFSYLIEKVKDMKQQPVKNESNNSQANQDSRDMFSILYGNK